jgi:hypothetical protein
MAPLALAIAVVSTVVLLLDTVQVRDPDRRAVLPYAFLCNVDGVQAEFARCTGFCVVLVTALRF